jgi:Domain of unknown function (DUF397)
VKTSDGWKKSSFSGTGTECVELHRSGAVRDSKNTDGPRLTVHVSELVAAVKAEQRG